MQSTPSTAAISGMFFTASTDSTFKTTPILLKHFRKQNTLVGDINTADCSDGYTQTTMSTPKTFLPQRVLATGRSTTQKNKFSKNHLELEQDHLLGT
jgi:hypothetical protein